MLHNPAEEVQYRDGFLQQADATGQDIPIAWPDHTPTQVHSARAPWHTGFLETEEDIPDVQDNRMYGFDIACDITEQVRLVFNYDLDE